jgi:hypothetical protein
MQSAFINTRADLDALAGTPEHTQFMAILAGSIYHLEKDDEAKTWKAVQDATMIERFEFTLEDFADVQPPALPEYIAPPSEEPDPKMVGIEFDGVMCSATRDDQNGIIAVVMAYQLQGKAFKSTQFSFTNGTKLTLTAANMQQFLGVWMPFRQSFFKPE